MEEYTLEPIEEEPKYTLEPIETSFRKAPEPTVWEKIRNIFPDDSTAQSAKATNALAYSEMLNITPSVAYEYYDEISKQVQDKLATEKIITEKRGISGAASSGFDTSILGMISRQKVPEPFESASQAERWIQGALHGLSDIPIFLTGYTLGGGTPISGMAGGFALTAGMRQVLMDRYSKGEVKDAGDFFDRLGNAVKETIKSEVVGGFTGGVGYMTPVWINRVSPGANPIGWKAVSELATMTTAGKLIEGQLPTTQEFVDNAAILAAMHAGISGMENVKARIPEVRRKLQDVYTETGMHPKDIKDIIGSKPVNMQEDVIDVIDQTVAEIKPFLPSDPVEKAITKTTAVTSGEVKPETMTRKDYPDLVVKTETSQAAPVPEESALLGEAKKYKTAEEFEKAFLTEIKHGRYWHITDNPNFTIDPNLGPRDMSSLANGRMSKGKFMVTSDLEYWAEEYPERKYVAEIDMSNVNPKDYYQVKRGFGNEFFVDNPANARVIKVVPLKQALKDSAKYQKWLEKNVRGFSEIKDIWNKAHQKPETTTPESEITSIKKAAVDAERLAAGQEPIESPVNKRTKEGSMEDSKAKVDSGEVNPRDLARKINNIVDIGERPIEYNNDLTLNSLLYDKTRIKNEQKELEGKLDDPESMRRWMELQGAFDANQRATKAIGSEWGYAGQALQNEMTSDYSLSAMINHAREDGIEITPEVIAKYDKISKKIQKAQDDLINFDKETANKKLENSIKKIANEEELKQRKEKRSVKKEELDLEFDNLINAFVKEYSGQLSANPFVDPARYKILIDLTRNRIKKGIVAAEDIVDSVYVSLKNAGLEINKRDLRDAISQYGITKEMSKDEIDVALREAKKIMRLTSALEDIKAGIMPEKSGLIREPESEKVKAMRREVAQDMREAGLDAETKRAAFIKLKERQIAEYERRLREGDFSKKQKPPQRELSEQELALRVKLDNLKRDYEKARLEDQLSTRSKAVVLKDSVFEAINLIKAVKSSYDLSALRQAAPFVLSHPIMGFRNIPEMFKALKSDEAALISKKEIDNRENNKNGYYKTGGVDFTEFGGIGTKAEEMYRGRWAQKIPGIPASERAFVAYLNLARADLFDFMVRVNFKDSKPTEMDLKGIGDFVNTATGRGKQKGYEKTISGLGKILWSPSLVLSRFQLILGKGLMPGGERTAASRKAVLKEYTRILSTAALIYSINAIINDEPVETDPTSSHFGEIKIGKTYIDMWGGLKQVTVFTSRLITGEKKTLSGKIVPLRGDYVPYGGADIWSTISDFMRTKLTPALGIAIDLRQGKKLTGEKFGLSDVPLELITPLAIYDLYQEMQIEGVPAGLALGTLGIFGAGIQTYDLKGARK